MSVGIEAIGATGSTGTTGATEATGDKTPTSASASSRTMESHLTANPKVSVTHPRVHIICEDGTRSAD